MDEFASFTKSASALSVKDAWLTLLALHAVKRCGVGESCARLLIMYTASIRSVIRCERIVTVLQTGIEPVDAGCKRNGHVLQTGIEPVASGWHPLQSHALPTELSKDGGWVSGKGKQ